MDNQSQFFYSSIFKISISPKNYHFSSLDWAFKLICEKSGYGGGPLSDKKYYFVQNTRPGHTFYEQGVVDGEKQRKFIDAGDSRPIGVIIYYLLSEDAKDVSLSILDGQGNKIQTFSKEEIPTERFPSFDARGYEQDLTTGKPKATVSQGLNRFIWGTRYPSVSSVPGRPPVIINPFAKPGIYQVCLTVDGETQTESFEVQINPNEKYTREETDTKGEFWMKLYGKAEEGIQTVLKAREAKEKVANTLADSSDNQILVDQGAKINALCDELEGSMMPVGTTLVQIINERTKLVPKLTWLHNVLETSEGPANQGVINVYNKVASEMDETMASFNSQLETEMAQFEQLIG
ncbi:hypothetical protein [Crocosphaera watsonii]|nr:hypothetical protein [Crocosphaera watsonii]